MKRNTKNCLLYTSFGTNWLPYVTSYYGYRVHPISGEKNYHTGVDIGMPEGTEIPVSYTHLKDVCWPVTAEFRKQLNDALIDGYGQAIENLQATLEATKGAAEKPSLTGALKENAGKVKEPVSYTHLDVYKRQPLYWTARDILLRQKERLFYSPAGKRWNGFTV